MNFTSPSQSFRIAAFFFLGAMALTAQSSNSNQEPAKVQLLASNTTTNTLFPAPAESITDLTPPKTQSPAAPLVNPALLPTHPTTSTITFAAVKEHTTSSKPWFTAGPNALPATIRLDPKFDPPTQQYGAAPAAVQFSFGRK